MPRFAKERAAADPTGFALVDDGRELTWAEVDDALNRCANLLLDDFTIDDKEHGGDSLHSVMHCPFYVFVGIHFGE